MLQTLKRRMADVQTIAELCRKAESHALADGQSQPGAEHFVLAALGLGEGSAARAFRRVQADPGRFRSAIALQYADALSRIGIDASALDDDSAEAPTTVRSLYRAAPSGQALMQALAGNESRRNGDPLIGAHVIEVAATMQRGVVARALRTMGVEPATLAAAAYAEAAEAANTAI